MDDQEDLTLIAGATGYIGGHLIRAFAASDAPFRCMAREPRALRSIVSGDHVVTGNVLDRTSLNAALQRVKTAYYLVHSMGESGSFAEKDRVGASYFAHAAADADVGRIIYLGGLGDASKGLSPHLKSRQEVGEILRHTGVQVIEFRASIVLGAGSLSFEMIRALVERLPVMVTPRWVSCMAQPISVKDVIDYLVQARTMDLAGNHIFEIGGPDRLSYKGLMREYARQQGLKRVMIPVPILTPWLSSLWLSLVTPLYAKIGRKLIESIRHPTVADTSLALKTFAVRPMGVKDSMAQAIEGSLHRTAD